MDPVEDLATSGYEMAAQYPGGVPLSAYREIILDELSEEVPR